MSISPIGPGLDDAAPDVAAARDAALARSRELEAGLGPVGALGEQVDLPPVVRDWSKHTGGADSGMYRRPGTVYPR